MTPEPTIDLELKFLKAIDEATHRMLNREVLMEVAHKCVGVVVADRLEGDTKIGSKVVGIGLTEGPARGLVVIKEPKDCDGFRFTTARIDTKIVSKSDCSNLFNIIHHLENCFK